MDCVISHRFWDFAYIQYVLIICTVTHLETAITYHDFHGSFKPNFHHQKHATII